MKYLMLLLCISYGVQGMEMDNQIAPLNCIVDAHGNQFVFNPQYGIYAQVVHMPERIPTCERCAKINFSSDGDIIVDGIILVGRDCNADTRLRERLDHIVNLQHLVLMAYKNQEVDQKRNHIWRSYASLYELYTISKNLKEKQVKTPDEVAFSKALNFLLNRLDESAESRGKRLNKNATH